MTWTDEKETRWAPVFEANSRACWAAEEKLGAEVDLEQALKSGSGAAIMVAGAIYDQRSAEHEARYQEFREASRIAEADQQQAEAGQ
jgi:hypothetical protein